MRLTLRTLLAYLDDILEPADAHELGRKIEDSEFASGLVHRIRSSIGRLRLGAPNVAGVGSRVDPNTVAEYLDNTLAAERVPDFERVCLESDVHLAEVASCHQVLTLVLGEPAQVAPALRERIYRIAGANANSLSRQTGPSERDRQPEEPQRSVDGEIDPGEDDPWEEGPWEEGPWEDDPWEEEAPGTEYDHRESNHRGGPIGLPWVGAIALTVITILVAGVWSSRGPLGGHSTPIARGLDSSISTAPSDVPPATDLASHQSAASAGTAASTIGSANRHTPWNRGHHVMTEGHDPGEFEGANFTPVDGLSQSTSDHAQTGPPEPTTLKTADVAPSEPGPEPGSTEGAPLSVAPEVMDFEHRSSKPQDGVSDRARADLPPSEEVALADAGAVSSRATTLDESVMSGIEVGKLRSDREVMVRWEERSRRWMRLPAGAPVAVGDQLMALPAYHPRLTFFSGVALTFDGVSAVRIEKRQEKDDPSVSIDYGQLTITSVGPAGTELALRTGNVSWSLRFPEAESSVVVQVQRVQRPGSDPEKVDAQVSVQCWGADGSCILDADGKPSYQIEPGMVCVRTRQQAAWREESSESPPWTKSTPLRQIERDAARTLEPILNADDPVLMSLMDYRSDHRRPEDRALLARCLCVFDDFDAIVNCLNDQSQRSWWETHFHSLQLALGRSPETAAKVRRTLERRRGRDGTQLYRMLWSYSDHDLRSGADRELIGCLDHDQLDLRVLAIENLRRITGATLAYEPWSSMRQRRRSITRWKKWQKTNLIVRQALAATPTRD